MTLKDLKAGDKAELVYLNSFGYCGDYHETVSVQGVSPTIIYANDRAFMRSNGLCCDQYGLRLEVVDEQRPGESPAGV